MDDSTPPQPAQVGDDNRQYDAIEGAMKDADDFELLWYALEEYRLAGILRESMQPVEEHAVLYHLAGKIEHNAKICLSMAVDLHASLVALAVQKALLNLDRKEA